MFAHGKTDSFVLFVFFDGNQVERCSCGHGAEPTGFLKTCHSKEDNERFTTPKIKSVVIERLCFLLLFCDFDHKRCYKL